MKRLAAGEERVDWKPKLKIKLYDLWFVLCEL